jgi:hypothetical protein
VRSKTPILCLFILSTACLDNNDFEDPETSPRNNETEIKISALAKIELKPGHSLTFYVDPSTSTSVVITEVTPPDSTGILRPVRRDGATALEIYNSIAPDAPVPPELETAHLAEVQAQGRANTNVQPLSLAPLPMQDDPPCTTENTFSTWFSNESGEGPDAIDSFYTSSGGPTAFWLSETTTKYYNSYGGGCNADGGTKDFKYCYTAGFVWSCTDYTSVPIGSTWYHEAFHMTEYYHGLNVLYPYQISGTSRLAHALNDL